MPKMSVILLMPIIHTLLRKGHSKASVYQELQISKNLMTDPDNYIDSAQYDSIFERAVAASKDCFFGLHIGTEISLDNLGLVGYILLNSNTLKQAFKNYQRYNMLLCSGIVYDLQVNKSEAKFSFWSGDPNRKINYHLMDSILSSTYIVIQRLTGHPNKLRRVLLTQNTPSDIQPYLNLFGSKLIFNEKETALIFDVNILDLPVVYRNPQLLQLMENHAVQIVRALKMEQTFSEKVSLTIMKRLDGTIPKIDEVAKSLGYSVRSIQLQLSKDGTTFRDLLTNVRKKMAESYLKNASSSISEISYLLGFSNPVSFQHAFKKWTGQTPGEYRKQHTNYT